jgi:cyanophycinase
MRSGFSIVNTVRMCYTENDFSATLTIAQGVTQVETHHSILNSRRGYLMPIGGAENRTVESGILNQFIRYAGGTQARIAVIPTASGFAGEVSALYCSLFREIGVADVRCVHVQTRQQANNAEIVNMLDGATGIFLTGGDQVKLVSLLGGTRLAQKITTCYQAGTTVAGTSAGASAMSRHMIAFGRSGGTPAQRSVQLAPGLGLIDSMTIDQHFRQRDRLGRLMTAIAINPSVIGVGVDEDTAFVIDPDGCCEVTGSNSVTIVDGTELQYTDIYAVKRHDPVAVMGMKVHVLTAGCQYNLQSLQPYHAGLGAQVANSLAVQPL